MSSSTQCGKIPFKLEGVWQGSLGKPYNPFKKETWVNRLIYPDENVINCKCRQGFDDEKPYPLNFDKDNWTVEAKSITIDDIHYQQITKKDMVVYTVDESQYSNGGETFLSICAKDKRSLLTFKRDFKLKGLIKLDSKVYQTI